MFCFTCVKTAVKNNHYFGHKMANYEWCNLNKCVKMHIDMSGISGVLRKKGRTGRLIKYHYVFVSFSDFLLNSQANIKFMRPRLHLRSVTYSNSSFETFQTFIHWLTLWLLYSDPNSAKINAHANRVGHNTSLQYRVLTLICQNSTDVSYNTAYCILQMDLGAVECLELCYCSSLKMKMSVAFMSRGFSMAEIYTLITLNQTKFPNHDYAWWLFFPAALPREPPYLMNVNISLWVLNSNEASVIGSSL